MLAITLAVASLAGPPIALDVDARDMARRIVHAKVTFPAGSLAVKNGVATVTYPKWIPGEHAPDGPLAGVIRLHFTSGGKELTWKRDDVEMFAFHVDAPASAAIEASFDFVTPTDGGAFSGSTMATENLGIVSFNQVLLVPDGARSDDVTYRTSLKIPAGWSFGSALDVTKKDGASIAFAPASLTTVVDSPVIMGRYYKRYDLGAGHFVDVAGESAAAVEAPADEVTEWKQLVTEAGALFGAHHYRHYDFLLALSDHVEDFGLEHHESSDNRLAERALIDDDKRRYGGSLLPHEYVHSWNGKFRRPAGLATGDYMTPMKDDLLWGYEGLTEYLGYVLSARSGLETNDELDEDLAFWWATMDQRSGRTWRPLGDTAVEAQILYVAASQWADARRSVDFYDESALLWLDVDMRIRAITKGQKSLDDFCKAFHGVTAVAPEGKPALAPYTFDELMAALNAVAPFDWAKWWHEKLESKDARAPLQALDDAGWTIGWTDEEPSNVKAIEGVRKTIDERFSIGVVINSEDQTIVDVVGGSSAYAAGIGPGMKIVGVNGRKFSKEVLDDALKASPKTKSIELLVENGEFYRTAKLDYHGGKRYPKLVRDDKKPDVLAQILKPKTPHAERTEKKKP